MQHRLLSVLLIVAVLLLCHFNNGEATKLDLYRAMMEKGVFTIKYSVDPIDVKLEDSEIYIKDDKIYPLSRDGVMSDERIVQPQNGVVARNGDDKYYSVTYRGVRFAGEATPRYVLLGELHYGKYCLQKNNELFLYNYINGKYRDAFNATKSGRALINKVKPIKHIPIEEEYIASDANYGTPIIGRILSAIYPNLNIPKQYVLPAYSYKGNGTTEDGKTYEDYLSENSQSFCAVRFFFDGDQLLKAHSVFYKKQLDGNPQEKTYMTNVVVFDVFSDKPDPSCFELPEKIKVIRDK